MKKLYDKNELRFSLIGIGIYVVVMMLADNASGLLGTEKLVTAPACLAMVCILYGWISRNGLKEKYGLCAPEGSAGRYLYFIPLALIASVNLWWGITLRLTAAETALYVISMLCVGFLEEILFRGLLYKAICRENEKQAVVISSLTFGVGHIVNLLNGRDIPETLLQLCYATAIGFLFVVIFQKVKSLIPCIITHGILNSLSAVADTEAAPAWHQTAGSAFLCAAALSYALYILYRTRDHQV